MRSSPPWNARSETSLMRATPPEGRTKNRSLAPLQPFPSRRPAVPRTGCARRSCAIAGKQAPCFARNTFGCRQLPAGQRRPHQRWSPVRNILDGPEQQVVNRLAEAAFASQRVSLFEPGSGTRRLGLHSSSSGSSPSSALGRRSRHSPWRRRLYSAHSKAAAPSAITSRTTRRRRARQVSIT